MTRLVLVLLLAAAPAAAQTTDALIDRVVQRQHLGESAAVPFGAYPTGFNGMDTTAVIDSVRAAFRRDARPDLLREALLYLDRPDAVRFERRTRLRSPSEGAIAAGMSNEAVKKGTLADSLLSDRYARALGTDSFMVSIVTHFIEQTYAQAVAAGEAPEPNEREGIEFMRAMIIAVILPQIEISARVALAGAAQPDVEAYIAFAESPPGRYVRQTALAGIRAAVLVRMGEVAAQGFENRSVGPVPVPEKPTGKP